VGFIPLVGSGSDLIIQAYAYGTTGKADPVVVTFGVIGIGFDVAGIVDFETTLPAAETAKGLVGVYKIGGPFTKEAIKGLTVAIKNGITPAEAYSLLKGSASFMADAAKAKVNPLKFRDTLEEALKLAKEKTGDSFNGLQLFSKSYSDLKASGAFSGTTLSFISKLKIAKYGMLAPETAKSVAKCGSECISLVEKYSSIFSSAKSVTKSDAISRLNSVSEFTKDISLTSSFKTGFSIVVKSGCVRGIIKALSLDACGNLIKRADGMFEAIPSETNLTAWKRLNIKDPASGKFHPGEASAAAQLESLMGGTLDRAPSVSSGKSPDFHFVGGPYLGKSIDLMYTLDDFTSFAMTGMNQTFTKKQSAKVLNIIQHLKKADYVVMDTRYLTSSNVEQLISYINKAIIDPASGLTSADLGRIILLK